jgi:hypothetical protein
MSKLFEQLSRSTYGQEMHEEMFSIPIHKREAQIKTSLRFHLIPNRMAITNTYNKCWWGSRVKGTLINCWWECKLMKLLWKLVWRFLKTLKLELIPYLSIYPTKSLLMHNKAHDYYGTIHKEYEHKFETILAGASNSWKVKNRGWCRGEYDQTTLYHIWKCNNEIHFLKLQES